MDGQKVRFGRNLIWRMVEKVNFDGNLIWRMAEKTLMRGIVLLKSHELETFFLVKISYLTYLCTYLCRNLRIKQKRDKNI